MIFSRCERDRTRVPTAQSLVRRPRRRTRSTPSHNLIKALATCGRGRPKSAVGGFGSRQPTTIVGCNCHEIIGKALLCVRCRRWKHSSQVSGAALKMLASLKGGQAVELLGRAVYSKYAASSFRCARILAAGWAHVLQWPDRQLFVCVDPHRQDAGKLERRASRGAAWASGLLQIRGIKLPMCTHPRCRLGPCAAVARPAAVCVCRSSSSRRWQA